MEEQFKAKPASLHGWGTRDGRSVESFLSEVDKKASSSTSLLWYTDPQSGWPLWIQLAYLWVKRHVLRRAL